MSEYAGREQAFNKSLGGILGGLAVSLVEADNIAIDKQIERTGHLLNGEIPNLLCDTTVTIAGLSEPLKTSMSIPPALIAPNSSLRITSAKASMDMTTSAHTEDTRKLDVGGSAEGKVGYGPFSLKIKADISVSAEKKRSSDYTSTTHAEITMAPTPFSEGLQKVIDAITATVATGLKLSEQVLIGQAEAQARKLVESGAGPVVEPVAG